MPQIILEQALFLRPDDEPPRLLAQSSGFDEAWLTPADRLILGFGDRQHGRRCPLTVFARPLTAKHVAVVRVSDDDGGSRSSVPTGLRFHMLVPTLRDYETFIRDPFLLAEKVEPTWDARGSLPSLKIPAELFSPRTLAQVRSILKRVKASALREGEDPEAEGFVRTVENSESPALLGGAQILVDGGRLIFERPHGDLALVSGLWLLLPEMTRPRLWPTSFAFSSELEFDVLVVPFLHEVPVENYTTEEQACDYPAGSYELALQTAAEEGTQDDLDAVFRKRDGYHTIRLALLLLALLSAVVLFARWMEYRPPDTHSNPANPVSPRRQEVAAAAGIVAAGDPWTVLGMSVFADMRRR